MAFRLRWWFVSAGALAIALVAGAVWLIRAPGTRPAPARQVASVQPQPGAANGNRQLPVVAAPGDPTPLPVAEPVVAADRAVPQADAPSSAVASAGEAAYADGARVLFLTIIGEHTYYHWGRAGDRPPRIDNLGRVEDAGHWAATDGAVEDDAGVADATAADSGEVEMDYGPAPQECPRTLPAGSTQATADALRNSSGCRYLSTCSVENDVEQCTWHYQGRG